MGYFDKKVVWITGASSGIGKELAVQLSELGAILVLTARRENELEKVKQLCSNAEVHLFPYDLENLENIEELLDIIYILAYNLECLNKLGKVYTDLKSENVLYKCFKNNIINVICFTIHYIINIIKHNY